jgi:uncharacterized coiled-coil protein SlyX
VPSLDLPLGSLDEDLEYCLHPVSFVLPPHFYDVVLVLIGFLFHRRLHCQRSNVRRGVTELAQVAMIVELEAVARSQANRIAELEATCADFKREKDKATDGYRRLAEKHKSFAEKAEHDKKKLVEAHAAKLTKLHADLDLETRSYTEYHQTVRCRLHKLHEAIASSFEEVKAQCLPFPNKGTKVEEMIDWVVEEVKAVPDIVWRLNDNFVVLGIKGVLSMLSGEWCQELGRLRDLVVPVTPRSWKMFRRMCINW